MSADIHEPDAEPPPIRVAVLDAERAPHRSRREGAGQDGDLRRLLAALEAALPVRFSWPGDELGGDPDAIVQIGGAPAEERPARPTLVLGGPTGPEAPRATVPLQLAADRELPEPLRGRRIPEDLSAASGPVTAPGARVLAAADGEPVWWRHGTAAQTVSVSRYPLARLGEGEALRSLLRSGRFMGLLPLLVHLEEALGASGWRRPPLRACFVLDDPNLHRPTYGFVNYRELARHATQHGYHVAMATVPIDGWLVNRRAAAVLAENPAALSLLIHGNDHVAEELGRLDEDGRAAAVLAQALRRTAGLERRAGVAVDRVVAPPHGACSEQALGAMFRLGMEAACISRPYPWRQAEPAPTALAGWHPAELVAGGLPVLPRYPLSGPREDLAFRALLGQPLILYGHHGDLAGGLDVLAEGAADVDALGDVRWERLSEIARASFATRRLGDRLEVRLHARRVSLEVPQGVASLRICLPEPLGGAGAHRLEVAGSSLALEYLAGQGSTEPIPVLPGQRLEISLAADRPLEAARVTAPRPRLWPWVRRALAEGRDRLQAGAPY